MSIKETLAVYASLTADEETRRRILETGELLESEASAAASAESQPPIVDAFCEIYRSLLATAKEAPAAVTKIIESAVETGERLIDNPAAAVMALSLGAAGCASTEDPGAILQDDDDATFDHSHPISENNTDLYSPFSPDDDDATEIVSCEQDYDGDGYGNGAPQLSADGDCNDEGEVPAGGEVDCDDTDPTIHPDATETLNDGIDQNCDGEDFVLPDDDDSADDDDTTTDDDDTTTDDDDTTTDDDDTTTDDDDTTTDDDDTTTDDDDTTTDDDDTTTDDDAPICEGLTPQDSNGNGVLDCNEPGFEVDVTSGPLNPTAISNFGIAPELVYFGNATGVDPATMEQTGVIFTTDGPGGISEADFTASPEFPTGSGDPFVTRFSLFKQPTPGAINFPAVVQVEGDGFAVEVEGTGDVVVVCEADNLDSSIIPMTDSGAAASVFDDYMLTQLGEPTVYGTTFQDPSLCTTVDINNPGELTINGGTQAYTMTAESN